MGRESNASAQAAIDDIMVEVNQRRLDEPDNDCIVGASLLYSKEQRRLNHELGIWGDKKCHYMHKPKTT